jgi:hypothetical protein
MINQKNDLNMITRKLETELLTFHFDDLEISEITTKTSWMKLHINVLFIKDNVQITKVLYKDYETGLWYYIKNDGMIISHKDTFNHTIKNLVDEMIYDCHIEIEEAEETEEIEETETSEAEETTTRGTMETLPHVDVDCSNLKKVPKNCLYGMFGGFPSISEMYNDICFCCIADRKGNECKGKETCGKTWERYKAITNPEWHHVSLNTLVNLDFDMLDEKRQLYLQLYREIKELIKDLHKCKSGRSYERRLAKMYIRNGELLDENKISNDYINYVTRKVSMCNVECGLWTSKVEEATGFHKSRRYNRHVLKY